MIGTSAAGESARPAAPWPSSTTRVAGVVGANADTSLSPAIHNAALRELGLDWVYVAFKVPAGAVKAAVEGVRALNIAGLSVTMPHKVEIADYLDAQTEVAQAVGAVNTVNVRGDQLIGDNTDVAGLIEGLAAATGRTLGDGRVVILGAGGAARAAGWAAISEGAESVAFVARRSGAASTLAEGLAVSATDSNAILPELASADPADAQSLIAAADIVISAVPSTEGRGLLFDPAWLRADACVFDLVYQPAVTPLLRAVEARGVVAAGGIAMLIAQAARQIEIWTGRSPSRTTMEEAATLVLAETRGAT